MGTLNDAINAANHAPFVSVWHGAKA